MLLMCLAVVLVACPTPPPTPPTITTFTATPTSLPVGGGTVELEWNVTGEATLNLEGVGTVTGTSKDVNVTASQTFKLTATNAGGKDEKTVGVTVATTPPPPPPGPPSPPPPPSPPTNLTGQVEGWSRDSRPLKLAWFDSTTGKFQSILETVVDGQGNFSLNLPAAETLSSSSFRSFRLRSGCTSGVTISPSSLLAVRTDLMVYSNATPSVEIGFVGLGTPEFGAASLIPGSKFVFYVLADQDATIKGSCAARDSTATYDIDFKKGWNAVLFEVGASTPLTVQYSSASAPANLKWRYAALGYTIKLDPPTTLLQLGKTYTATLTELDGTPVNAQGVTWTSNSPWIASVDTKGVITTKDYGQFGISGSYNGLSTSIGLTVGGLSAAGGTWTIEGASGLGTAMAFRYREQNNQPPANALPITVTGPNGWNGGAPLNLTYPANESSFWTTIGSQPLAGTYTATIGTGATASSMTFTVDPSITIGPAQNLTLTDYSTSSVSATWQPPNGTSQYNTPYAAELFDATSNQRINNAYQTSYSGGVYWSGLSIDPTHQNELRVSSLSFDPNLPFGATPAKFNVSRTSKLIDYKPIITRLGFGGGPASGGVKLFITGRNFSAGANVSFGNTPSTSVSVDNATQITAVVPARTAGIVDVTVTTNIGTSLTSSATKFQYFSITEYAVTGTAKLTPGGDGNVWFAENSGSSYSVGKITSAGAITRYPTTSSISDLTLGPDGNVWFAYQGYSSTNSRIGKITPTGTITDYSLPEAFGFASMITAGPDGRIWVGSSGASRIGKINTDGTGFTDYPLPISGGLSENGDMRSGPDGNVWFTDVNGARIGKASTSGTVSMFTVSSGGCCTSASVGGLVSGPDNSIWATLAGKLGKVASGGSITDFPLPSGQQVGSRITSGTDGNLWYTTANVYYSNGPNLGRMTPTGTTTTVTLADAGNNCCSTGTYDVITMGGKIWYSRNNLIGVLTP